MKKVKAVLFDLDGVLVDACDWHYEALNLALLQVCGRRISRKDHEEKYNGLPTNVKLDLLKLNENDKKKVWEHKQEYTIDTINKRSHIQQEKIDLFNFLHEQGLKVICVTNSIRMTAKEMLLKTGQLEHIDFLCTNEDVVNNKPHPDCYDFVVQTLDLNPDECIIVEDSPKGISSAQASLVPDSNIWKVKNSKCVNTENYRRFVNEHFDSDGG